MKIRPSKSLIKNSNLLKLFSLLDSYNLEEESEIWQEELFKYCSFACKQKISIPNFGLMSFLATPRKCNQDKEIHRKDSTDLKSDEIDFKKLHATNQDSVILKLIISNVLTKDEFKKQLANIGIPYEINIFSDPEDKIQTIEEIQSKIKSLSETKEEIKEQPIIINPNPNDLSDFE